MTKRAVILLALGLSLGACSYGDEAAEPDFPVATVLLDDGEETTLVTVEVAETPEQHELGLAGRESLPDDRGMVFVFFEEPESLGWMQDVPIPLSIALFDHEGTIVEILDVDPCAGDSCRVYDVGVSYAGALLVNQGAFEEWGIAKGDEARLTR